MKEEREGFYTKIKKGYKKPLVGRIKGKNRTLRYFIEGLYLLSESSFENLFKEIDKAHETAA